MLTFNILLFLAVLPALGSYYYSYNQTIFSLSSSVLFIILFSTATLIITSRLSKRLAFGVNTIVFLTILIFEIILTISYYLQGEGFNERFFFHFTLGTIKSTWLNYPALFWLITLLLTAFSVLIYRVSQKKLFQNYSLKIAIILFVTAAFSHSAIKEFSQYQLGQFSNNKSSWTIEQLGDLGLNMENMGSGQQTIAEPGKNLVLIYMESLESIYTNEDNFKSLTPNLNHYKEISSWFSNIHQTPGTDWTIAGISSSLCGTPLLSDNTNHGNDIMSQGFLNKASCLSDILHHAGYRQSYLGGATLDFAGKGIFLRDHHYDDVSGLNELLPGYKNKDYLNGWGFYDDTLLDMAADKFKALADKEQPFNLTLLTLDTHPPEGHPSASCSPYQEIDNSILHAVHCTDELIGRFIQKISRHPAWKDTVVVLFSDHLSMRNSAEAFYPKDKTRKLSLIVLNSELSGEIKIPGSHMDFAPTVLDLLKVKHNQQFLLGQSLLNKKQNKLETINKTELYSAIRYANSHILTHKETQLCPEQTFHLKSNSKQQLSIGNYNIALTYQGFSVSHFTFSKKLALIAFFNPDKQIKKAFIVDKFDIPYLISENTKLNFILLLSEQENLALYFGHSNKLSPVPLPKGVLLNRLDVNLAHCFDAPDLLTEDTVLLSDLDPYKKQCQQFPENLQAIYHESSRKIQIPAIMVNDRTYSAILKKHDQKPIFALSSYTEIPPYKKKDKHCLPKLSPHALHIPQITIRGKKYNIILPISDDNTGQMIIPVSSQAFFKTQKL